MDDADWIRLALPQYDTPEKVLELVLENPNWLTDGYYRDLGNAVRKQAAKVLRPADETAAQRK